MLGRIIEKNIPIDIWMAKASVRKNSHQNTTKCNNSIESDWIDYATCYHLAAKFNPKGLHLLLTNLKAASPEKFQEIYQDGTVTPLHVAALNCNSISLR